MFSSDISHILHTLFPASTSAEDPVPVIIVGECCFHLELVLSFSNNYEFELVRNSQRCRKESSDFRNEV